MIAALLSPAARPVLMDGAMGTWLAGQGAKLGGECLERWNLRHADAVQAAHAAYAAAGAQLLLTHTFQANPTALAHFGAQGELVAIWQAALANARAAGLPVVADIGTLPPSDLAAVLPHAESADAILLETWSDPETLRECMRLRPAKPVLICWAFLRTPDGQLRTITGLAPEDCAHLSEVAGVVAVGANCGRGLGLPEWLDLIQRFRAATRLPIVARPNAGEPADGAYPITPEILAAWGPQLLAAGVHLLGGCCGTTPAHVAALAK